MSFNNFVAALDLVPASRARKIRLARRRNTECETIDLEEPQTSISPTTPRTPKSLMSQLSRDASNCNGSEGGQSRRRLSYLAQMSDKTAENNEEESGSDGESSSSSSEEAEDPKLHKKSLLSIDVTSGLGQRVLKHMTSEAHVPIIADVEQFCHTPIKDMYQDRLRARQQVYPITYKLTHKRLRQQQHCHVYKFTLEDKVEFMEKMKTGLARRSRDLLRHIRKCSVVLRRLSLKTLCKWKPSLNKISVSLKPLTIKEIAYWTTPKVSMLGEISPAVFPDGPTILLTDIDRVLGLRRKLGESLGARRLSASHCVSEVANAELQQQKLTVYRSLLLDLSHSDCEQVETIAQCRQHCSLVRSSSTKTKDKMRGTRKDHFPVLYSMLNTLPPEKSNKNRLAFSANLKNPLKIEIPSSSGVKDLVLSSGENRKNCASDDSFSIRTSSSDEDCPAASTCCVLCTRRQSCECTETQTSGMGSAVPQGQLSKKMSRDLDTSHLSSVSASSSHDFLQEGQSIDTKSVFISAKGLQSSVVPEHSVSSCSSAGSQLLSSSQAASHNDVSCNILREREPGIVGTSDVRETGGEKCPPCPEQLKLDFTLQSDPSPKVDTQLEPAQNFARNHIQRKPSTATRSGVKSYRLEMLDKKKRRAQDSRRNGMNQAKNIVSYSKYERCGGQQAKSPDRRHSSRKRKVDSIANVSDNHKEKNVAKNRTLRSGNSIASRIQGLVFEKAVPRTSMRQKRQKGAGLSGRENAPTITGDTRSGLRCTATSSRSESFAVTTRTSSKGFSSSCSDKNTESVVNSKKLNSLLVIPEMAKNISEVMADPLLDTPRTQLNGSGSSGSVKMQTDNPFLLGKEQAVLFSSTIRAQARRQLVTSEEPHLGTKNRLVSGNLSRTCPSHWESTPNSFFGTSSQLTGVLGFLSSSLNATQSQDQSNPSLAKREETLSSETLTKAHVCKRLSPLQMLSVLESAKEGTMSPSRRLLMQKGKGRSPRSKKPLQSSSKKTGYLLRAMDSNSHVKKMRLGSCM